MANEFLRQVYDNFVLVAKTCPMFSKRASFVLLTRETCRECVGALVSSSFYHRKGASMHSDIIFTRSKRQSYFDDGVGKANLQATTVSW